MTLAEVHGNPDATSGRDGPPTDWLTDYLARANELWRRAARSSVDVANRWQDRSLQDGEWTADTVTADLIEAWDELTPIMGEGWDLYLEAVQRVVRPGGASD